jgi:hypothetical protein
MKSLRILSLILLALPATSIFAQTPPPRFDPSRAAANTIQRDATAQSILRDQQEKVSNILEDENSFAPQSPGDDDIGQQLILKRNEKSEAFSVVLDSGYFFTDNAAQTNRGARSDSFFVGGGSVTWQPRITNRIYGNISIAQHWYRYNKYDVLNYESGDVDAGIILLMPEIWNTLWFINYSYQRITQGIDNDAIYDTNNINLGVQKTVLFDRKNSLNLGLLASISLDASPSELQRNEYSAAIGWNYKIKRTMILSLNYQLLCYDYQNFDGRVDWSNNFGASFTYRPKEWLELAASWNYTLNESNKEAFSYNVQLAGPAVSVRMKF